MTDKTVTTNTMTCFCIACDPKGGEIGRKCIKEKKWTHDLLQRKLAELSCSHSYVVSQPSSENIDYLVKCAKEYSNVWIQDRAN